MRLQEQARKDRDQFQMVVEKQKIERDLELKAEQERAVMIQKHAAELKKQMLLNEEKRSQAKRDSLEEGKKVKDKIKNEKKVLEEIKTQKISGLRSSNIPEKYVKDLAKKKINL